MGFFIRKAFKAGPVRFNLSKGGIGLSAGVTGARIGLNRRGMYVYGGRHGLYYRKQLNSRGRGSSTGMAHSGGLNRSGSTNDIFVDTGSTYPALYHGLKTHPFPDLKENPHWSRNIFLWMLVVAVITLAIVVYYLPVIAISVTGAGILTFALIRDQNWRKKGQTLVETLSKTFEDSPDRLKSEPVRNFINTAPNIYSERFIPDLYSVLLQIAVEQPDDAHIDKFNQLENELPVSEEFINHTKRAILSHYLDAVLEDHLLSEDEELQIRWLLHRLKLPENFAEEELRYLELASSIRNEMEKPLVSHPSSIPLVRGEICYAEFKNTRLLEERVLHRFQRNSVQYRKIGYEIQLEGTMTITDRRLVITGRGSREYRLNRIADVITDLEANVIELILMKRKTPVFLTHPASMVISSSLEKVIRYNRLN